MRYSHLDKYTFPLLARSVLMNVSLSKKNCINCLLKNHANYWKVNEHHRCEFFKLRFISFEKSFHLKLTRSVIRVSCFLLRDTNLWKRSDTSKVTKNNVFFWVWMNFRDKKQIFCSSWNFTWKLLFKKVSNLNKFNPLMIERNFSSPLSEIWSILLSKKHLSNDNFLEVRLYKKKSQAFWIYSKFSSSPAEEMT